MSDLPYDYEPETPDDGALSELQELCRRFAELTLVRDHLAGQLSKIDEQLKEVSHRAIPEVMARLKMRGVETESGVRVEMVEHVHASLPSDPARRAAALEVVRASGNEGAIKTTVELSFGRNSAQHVRRLTELLRQSDVHGHAHISTRQTIHAGTYKKLVRELLENNPETDLGTLGAYRQRVAEIKL